MIVRLYAQSLGHVDSPELRVSLGLIRSGLFARSIRIPPTSMIKYFSRNINLTFRVIILPFSNFTSKKLVSVCYYHCVLTFCFGPEKSFIAIIINITDIIIIIIITIIITIIFVIVIVIVIITATTSTITTIIVIIILFILLSSLSSLSLFSPSFSFFSPFLSRSFFFSFF